MLPPLFSFIVDEKSGIFGEFFRKVLAKVQEIGIYRGFL